LAKHVLADEIQASIDDPRANLSHDEVLAELFARRGLAAIARSEAAGDWIPAETVIAKLEAKVEAVRAKKMGDGQ
jgi:hypothetical protein